MKKQQFIKILHKYVNGKANENEKELIETYYHLLLEKLKLESRPAGDEDVEGSLLQDVLLSKIWDQINDEESVNTKGLKPFAKTWQIAATIAVLIIAGIIFYTMAERRSSRKKSIADSQQQDTHVIKPGGNKAVLTLSNGKKIFLDNTSNGSLAKQGNVTVINLNGGQLAYKNTYPGHNEKFQPVYNTLSTPRGGQYELTLPDGTKVWLNAASSVHYPVVFSGQTRTVELKGEGYFEIAQDAQKPFIVQTDKIKIEVLGTSFDVNSYTDEDEIKATLEGGSIKMIEGKKSILLKPGECVSFDKKNGDMSVGKANVAADIAWKNGLFSFDNTNIKEIMARVSRWYDVNVVYATTELSHKSYSGVLPRYSEVSALLKMLEMTGTIHFKIKDRTIIVMN